MRRISDIAKTKYSKPSDDIAVEATTMAADSQQRFHKQAQTAKFMATFSERQNCACCGSKLSGVHFAHRGVEFVECDACGHILSKNEPPSGYPQEFSESTAFSCIYPELTEEAYRSRRARIYAPKLDWILSVLADLGLSKKQMLEKRWLEIGSGAGYFVSAAIEQGIGRIVGLETDEQLVASSRRQRPNVPVRLWRGTFDNAVREFDADIYCSFFVLEHVGNLAPVWEALREKPPGTVFAFSVPLFGFSCLLEQAFPNRYARNLDGVVHTQLFTESSLSYAMETAGYHMAGEWIFGQDISDLSRLLKESINPGLASSRIFALLSQKLSRAQDPLQAALDGNKLADQRHLVFVKASN